MEGSDMFVVECTSTPGNEIELTIDSDTSVGIDACAELSRAVEAQFDRDEEDFSLTVMSAGIGSELKSLRQYRKLAGKSAEVLLTSGVKILAKLEEVNVLTNNLLAAQALAKNKQANVIVTGGNLVHSHLYVAGEMFMRNLDKVYISKAFMGVGGADLSAGYTVNYSTELIVYQTIKAIADQLIIVLDSSKFNRTTFLSLGSLTFSDVIISDKGIPASYREFYETNGVKVLN